jgi:hypothetical protein
VLMLSRKSPADDGLLLMGDIHRGKPCVTAATDSMAADETWVYFTLEAAVAQIIDNNDGFPAKVMAKRIRQAVERGIARGTEIRRKDRRA